ncbi:MAG: PKD domain-containing protein [Candidatus Taylorbacteria bacterium]
MKKYIIAVGISILSVASVVGAQGFAFTSDLSLGSKGADVIQLQTWLIENGYDIPAVSSGVAGKGYFGVQTRNAVSAYQKVVGLPAFGFFGPLTRSRVNNGQPSPSAPTITSANGPSTLSVNQEGLWTVGATNPLTGNLEYSADWGDELFLNAPNASAQSISRPFVQSASFTHSFAQSGVYSVRFTVRNDRGFTAVKIISVTVGNAVSSLRVITPNGGESWQSDTKQSITWTAPQYFRATYASLQLVPYYPSCVGQICPMGAQSESSQTTMMYPYRAPYTIANNISIDDHSYSWNVGSVVSIGATTGYGIPTDVTIAPDGQYTIQICEVGTSNCDSSDAPFSLYTSTSGNRPPVIESISAPATLSLGQTGTWTIHARDPENDRLNYSVDWGENLYELNSGGVTRSTVFIQGTTFTHSYTNAGTYRVTFTVRDSAGLTAETSSSVIVASASPAVTLTSPNAGERWAQNSTHAITWKFRDGVSVNTKVDLYLGRQLPIVCITTPCGPFFESSTFVLDKNISGNNPYYWIVGTDIVNNPIPSGNYGVRVCTASTDNCDFSDAPFTIASTLLQVCPQIKITNYMPMVSPSQNVPGIYYILNGGRRELSEFDLNWVNANCRVPEQIVN